MRTQGAALDNAWVRAGHTFALEINQLRKLLCTASHVADVVTHDDAAASSSTSASSFLTQTDTFAAAAAATTMTTDSDDATASQPPSPPLHIYLPLRDGRVQLFEVHRTTQHVMHTPSSSSSSSSSSSLSSSSSSSSSSSPPLMHTFTARRVSLPHVTAVLDVSDAGFHAQIFTYVIARVLAQCCDVKNRTHEFHGPNLMQLQHATGRPACNTSIHTRAATIRFTACT
jgi:hypothetical protein